MIIALFKGFIEGLGKVFVPENCDYREEMRLLGNALGGGVGILLLIVGVSFLVLKIFYPEVSLF